MWCGDKEVWNIKEKAHFDNFERKKSKWWKTYFLKCSFFCDSHFILLETEWILKRVFSEPPYWPCWRRLWWVRVEVTRIPQEAQQDCTHLLPTFCQQPTIHQPRGFSKEQVPTCWIISGIQIKIFLLVYNQVRLNRYKGIGRNILSWEQRILHSHLHSIDIPQ